MKFIDRLVLISSLASSLCFAGELDNPSSKFDRLKISAKETFIEIAEEIPLFPEVYSQKLKEETFKAEQRVDPKLIPFNYILRESSEFYWRGEKDFFYEEDIKESEDLTKDILKDSLRETKDSLPEVGEVVNNLKGFVEKKLHLRVEPKKAPLISDNLPPETEQELRKRQLLDREALTLKARGTLRKAVHKTFGQQTEFHSGFELHHLDEPEYFMSMKNPHFFGSQFAEFRTSYGLNFDESWFRAELGKEIGRGVYMGFEAEQESNSDYYYGLSFKRGLREHDSVSLKFSFDDNLGAYVGLKYNAILGDNPLKDMSKDIQRFLFNKK